MSQIGSLLVWLRRSRHSRGFGVQSPWAYRFIRYVVNEHYPYYAYDDLSRLYEGYPKQIQKLCRLYFRIANFWQAEQALDYSAASETDIIRLYGTFMKRGCNKLEVVPVRHAADFSSVRLMRLSVEGDYRQVFEKPSVLPMLPP